MRDAGLTYNHHFMFFMFVIFFLSQKRNSKIKIKIILLTVLKSIIKNRLRSIRKFKVPGISQN